ncbi:hypothetical protein C8P63_12179 [Melghirimyces profundicolus]|uniref:Uncharacterized protein n=1 Tax=Melghirimyces profundicolus TaxID=1242148 RepID=A0A2T6BGL4_9BACL|nr:hypothetical protein [Melghirimyces profundicolus]PTX55199.1 hypothetical protein C8P63_12179 [Melghirimyces profundicolus]
MRVEDILHCDGYSISSNTKILKKRGTGWFGLGKSPLPTEG